MVLNKFIGGTKAIAAEVNQNVAEALTLEGLNAIRIAIDREADISLGSIDGFFDAYIDTNGRYNTVNTANTTALFDTDEYQSISVDTFGAGFVVIQANNVFGSWNINDCLLQKISDNQWVVYCTTGTDEVKRAQVHKTLWYGTNGTDPRASSSFITGITNIYTADARDIGKQAFWVHTQLGSNQGNATYVITPDNTTTNTDSSSWSRVEATSTTTVDEIGTDRSGDERNNPSTYNTQGEGVNAGSSSWRVNGGNLNSIGTPNVDPVTIQKAIFLLNGNYTGALTGNMTIQDETDFNTDNGIPVFEEWTDNISSLIEHDIPSGTFDNDINTGFATPLLSNNSTGASTEFRLFSEAVLDFGTYVRITAASLSSPNDLNNANTSVLQLSANEWVVYTVTGVAEDERAELYDQLFRQNGDEFGKIRNFSGISSIATSVARDIGKQWYYARCQIGGAGSSSNQGTMSYVGTFQDTTNNTDASFWSRHDVAGFNDGGRSRLEVPNGVSLVTVNAPGPDVNNFGTDRSADEQSNPATVAVDTQDASGSSVSNVNTQALIGARGAVTWVFTDYPNGGTSRTNQLEQFTEDHGIPAFELTVAAAPSFNGGDTGFQPMNTIVDFTAFDGAPQKLQVRLNLDPGNPTAGVPALKGIFVRCTGD